MAERREGHAATDARSGEQPAEDGPKKADRRRRSRNRRRGRGANGPLPAIGIVWLVAKALSAYEQDPRLERRDSVAG